MPEVQIPKVLSIDTATHRGSVALVQGRDVVAELRLALKKTHSERLLASMEHLLAGAGWSLGDLTLVAVGIGPGSFTGIRIGVSTAMGLAQSLDRPLACVSGLDVVAHDVGFLEGRIGVVLDAQRSQVYYAEYTGSRGRVRRRRGPVLCYPRELQAGLGPGRIYLVGDGAARYARVLGASRGGFRRLVLTDLFLAPGIARLALARRRTWRSGDALSAEPLYIRPPDALRKREAVRARSL